MNKQKQVELDLCKQSFFFFVAFIFEHVEHKTWKWYDFHKRVANIMLNIPSGGRYILNCPFRLGKTKLTQLFMAWKMLLDPTSTFVYLSYDKGLAEDKCSDSKLYVEFCSKYFGIDDLGMKRGKNSASRWVVNAGGYVYAKGTGTPVTGYGADTMLIIDDPNKPADRQSPVTLKKRNVNYVQTISNRVNRDNPAWQPPILVIQQRICEEDMSGFLLKGGSGEEWTHICIAGHDDNDVAVCPEMLPMDVMLKYKDADPFTYYAQIMQRPVEDVGNFFARNKIVLAPNKPSLLGKHTIISVDASGKGDITNDFNAISVITTDNINYWVLEVHNFKSDITLLLTRLRELRNKYGANVPILLEAKANGLACAQILRKEMSGILETTPKTDKVERASVVKYLFDANNVQFCCAGLVWGEVVQQFSSFPHVAHDDIVDSVVQGITWLRDNTALITNLNTPKVEFNRRTYGSNVQHSNPTRGY